jgi:hypothetical protein
MVKSGEDLNQGKSSDECPQPEPGSLLAGTPFESPFDKLTVPSNVEGLTALSLSRTSRPRGKSRAEIEGVARPTGTFKTVRYVWSATVPTKTKRTAPLRSVHVKKAPF